MRDEAKKFAYSKNVPETSFSLWMVMQLVLITSSAFSLLTLVLVGKLELPDNILTTIMLNMIIPGWVVILFFGFGKYFYFAKILEIHYLNKLLTNGINKLDMYWWRKYRKQSPVTEILHKMQEKTGSAKRKLTKPQKALIFGVLMVLLCYFYLYDDVVDIANSIQEDIKHNEEQQNNLGKIFDGLTYKRLEP